MIKSNLVPQSEGQQLTAEEWVQHTSEEYKWELWDGIPFYTDGVERDRLLLCLLYSVGLEYFVKQLLPYESRRILTELIVSLNRNIKES